MTPMTHEQAVRILKNRFVKEERTMKISTMVEIINSLEKLDDFITEGYISRDNENNTLTYSASDVKAMKDELRITISMIKDIEL